METVKWSFIGADQQASTRACETADEHRITTNLKKKKKKLWMSDEKGRKKIYYFYYL